MSVFSDSHVDRIVGMLNATIDLPVVGERVEALLLWTAIRAVEAVVLERVPAIAAMIGDKEVGLKQSECGAISERIRDGLGIDLPVFEEEARDAILDKVTGILVTAASEGGDLEAAIYPAVGRRPVVN